MTALSRTDVAVGIADGADMMVVLIGEDEVKLMVLIYCRYCRYGVRSMIQYLA